MPGIGPSAVYRGGRSASRPAGRPGFSAYPLDRGIRPASNASSGDPSEVADGEVKAHLGNPGLITPFGLRLRFVTTKPTRGNNSPACHSILATTRRARSHDFARYRKA